MFASMIKLYTPIWLAWGGLFAVIEGTALWGRKTHNTGNGTLSALVWRFIGKGHTVHRVVFAAGWMTLTSHFFFHLP